MLLPFFFSFFQDEDAIPLPAGDPSATWAIANQPAATWAIANAPSATWIITNQPKATWSDS